MAFATCPNCRAQVNDQAPQCPQCGQPLRTAATAKKGLGTGAIIAIVLAVILVGGGGIFTVLAVYGARSYIANAKTAEARNALGQIAKDAVTAYETEDASGKKHLCPSGSSTVPPTAMDVKGKKYQSAPAEWARDAPRRAGFACLKFEMDTPQYFQYGYLATATDFTAIAHGDLNGDGALSTFQIKGHIVGDKLVVDPTITEKNPKE